MICKLCGEDKLSKEFPHQHLTEECEEHPILHCLKVSIFVYINTQETQPKIIFTTA